MAEQGEGLGGHDGGSDAKTLDQCKSWCVQTDGCHSIVWRAAGDCWMNDKCVTAEDQSADGSNHNGFKSYYIPCTGPGMLMLRHYYYYIYNNNNISYKS